MRSAGYFILIIWSKCGKIFHYGIIVHIMCGYIAMIYYVKGVTVILSERS